MIVTSTPFRISFFGGGTDVPDFFEIHGGSVISTTFDKHCYVTTRHLPPFFEYENEAVYSRIERVKDPSEFEHPLVREAMDLLNMSEMRISYEADLPARSGLGTSSSFAVGLLNAFHCIRGERVSARQLAREAIYVERNLCGEEGGWQDQIAAAYGGLNRIDFADGDFSVRPVVMAPARKRELEENLLMFFTGFTRFSADVQRAEGSHDKQTRLVRMLELVDEAEAILCDGARDLGDFGRLLDETWRLKRGTSAAVSTVSIDRLYDRGVESGALGGKLLGAGGGGFLLFYVEPDLQARVRAAMSDLLEVPFRFEDKGTRVAYFASEDYSKRGDAGW